MMVDKAKEQTKVQEATPEAIPPPPRRPPPVPEVILPEQLAEQREVKRVLEAKAQAKAKPPPPINPMYQEGHIEIDFKTKQAVMTLQKVKAPPPTLDENEDKPKGKAPPPSLNEEESRNLTWKFADSVGNAAKAERAQKAEHETKFKAAPPALQQQKAQGPPNLGLRIPSKQEKLLRELEEANRIRRPGKNHQRLYQDKFKKNKGQLQMKVQEE
jgi:hypothetical protein